MLAVLTETLDSIPVDEDGLPSFEALADGDVTNASDRSCPSSPDGSPHTPEPEEPSLVRSTASLPLQDSPITTTLGSKHMSFLRHDHQPCACCCCFASPWQTADKILQQDWAPKVSICLSDFCIWQCPINTLPHLSQCGHCICSESYRRANGIDQCVYCSLLIT